MIIVLSLFFNLFYFVICVKNYQIKITLRIIIIGNNNNNNKKKEL